MSDDPAAERKRVLAMVKRHVVLPDRIRGAVRDWVLAGIAESVVKWRAAQPHVEPYRKGIGQMRKIAKQLGHRIGDASNELAKIEEKLPKINEHEILGYRAESDLRSIITRAADSLEFWTRMHARTDGFYRAGGRGRYQDFSVSLTTSIYSFMYAVNRSVWRDPKLAPLSDDEIVLRNAPLSDGEIENKVLGSLSERDGLPKLTIKTKKRQESRRKAAAKTVGGSKGVG